MGVAKTLKTAEERLNSMSWETKPQSTDTVRRATSQLIGENDDEVQQSSP